MFRKINFRRFASLIGALLLVVTLGACGGMGDKPTYDIATPSETLLEKAKKDPALKAFVKRLEDEYRFLTHTAPAQTANDLSTKSTVLVKKDFKSVGDFKPIGNGQTDSIESKVTMSILGAAGGVAAAATGGISLGNSMPSPDAPTANAVAQQGQTQSTSGVSGNVTNTNNSP